MTGDFHAQVGQFGDGEAVFLHQGNWVETFLKDRGVDFEMGLAPHASVAGEHNAIFVIAPSFYVINNESDNIEEAKAFLNYLATSEEGADYILNEANLLSAFTTESEIESSALLFEAFRYWMKKDNGFYTSLFMDMPDGFGMETLGPIYESFAKDDIDKEEFIMQIAEKIEGLE